MLVQHQYARYGGRFGISRLGVKVHLPYQVSVWYWYGTIYPVWVVCIGMANLKCKPHRNIAEPSKTSVPDPKFYSCIKLAIDRCQYTT